MFFCPITCYFGEESNSHLARASFQGVAGNYKIPLGPLLSRVTAPSPSATPQQTCAPDPSPDPLPFPGAPQCLSCIEGPQNEHRIPGAALSLLSKWSQLTMATALVLLDTLFLIQPRMPPAFLATWAHTGISLWILWAPLCSLSLPSISRRLGTHRTIVVIIKD